MKIGGYELNVPFVTTSSDHVKIILELAQIKKEERVADLGSGDGRMAIAFAKAGAQVTGIEHNSELVHRSQKRIEEEELQSQITIIEKSFWDIDLSEYECVYIYGMQSVMDRLEQKLENELRPGTKFISNIFRLPHWKIKKSKDGVNLYIKS